MAIRCFGLMLALVRCLITVSIALLLHVAPATAVLNSDSYDGNIYALYAGNGSLAVSYTHLTLPTNREV